MPGGDLFRVEPPIGIEPMTYALRGTRSPAAHPLAAPMPRAIAQMALAALEFRGNSFHEPFHALSLASRRPCSRCVTSPRHSHQDSQSTTLSMRAQSCLPRTCQLRQGTPTRDDTASQAALSPVDG